MVKGEVKATVKTPVFWEIGGEQRIQHTWWTSLAILENTLLLTVDQQAYSVTLEGEATPFAPFSSGVSEIRVWENRRGRGYYIGVCLPQENLLRLGLMHAGDAGNRVPWPTLMRQIIGPRLGQEVDFLFYPVSFDVGPDGRIYVLDAGNSRIVVFDQQGQNYITQWGRRGDKPGEFDFGEGNRVSSGALDFTGSIAVDSQGYIYVADGSGRVQVFAP